MEDFQYKNIMVGLNYGTTDTENSDVIYIETLGKYAGDGGIVSLTVEEAEMISKELMKFIRLF